jgi:hypothetical protein
MVAEEQDFQADESSDGASTDEEEWRAGRQQLLPDCGMRRRSFCIRKKKKIERCEYREC